MAQIAGADDFRPGLKIKQESGMRTILECSRHKMGRGGAIVSAKPRSVVTKRSLS